MTRGPDAGVRLAYLWAAYPFTAYALESNSDDALVALLVVAALLAARWAPAAGGGGGARRTDEVRPAGARAAALAGLRRARCACAPAAAFAGAFALASGVVMLPVLLGGSGELATFWRHTIAYQANRGSPFSVWGLWGGLGYEQRLVQGAAAGLALAGFIVPRRRGLVEVAAMGAAILIAVQLGLTHWFYLYIPWFFPLVAVALEQAPRAPPESHPSDRSGLACRRRVTGDQRRGAPCGAGGEQQLLDRVRAQRLAGADEHATEPRIVLGGLELHRHLGDHRLERLLALDADDAAARAGHADIGDVRGPAGQHPRVGGGDVGVGARPRR